MCVFCQFFEVEYGVPAAVALDPARSAEYERLQFGGKNGKHKLCATRECTRTFLGKRQAVHLSLDAHWEFCEHCARERAATKTEEVA